VKITCDLELSSLVPGMRSTCVLTVDIESKGASKSDLVQMTTDDLKVLVRTIEKRF
jgi:hypothetical protein